MAIYSLNGETVNSAYDVDGEELSSAYDIEGNLLFTQEQKHYNYDDYTVSDMFAYQQTNTQSFAVYKGVIAQVRQTDAIHLIDISTHQKIRAVAMDTGHGNSCMFSDEFYEEDDEFPLFYVRNANVWVYRIVGTSSTLIKKYSFYSGIIGTYVAGFGADFESRRFYTASYTEGDYETKTGLLRICVWDMDDVTLVDASDNKYSLGLIESKDLTWFDRFEAVQGCCYHDGYLFIACGYGAGQQYVVLVNTSTLQIDHVISLTGEEIEGCAWVDNEYLIAGLGPKFIAYKKVTFAEKSYQGKTLSILGDSISTYTGYIPSGNANYYTGSNCGVTSVDQTWWKRLADSMGMTLNVNNSWSGSRVSTTNGVGSAGVTRANNLGTNPNVIIVYMGINDFNNEVATATFRSAYGTMLDNIKTAYPNAELYCSTLPVCERNGATGDPEINDDGVYLSEYNQIITEVATAKGADILDLANCGITYATLSTYMGDWKSATGKALHPNADGMALIAQKAITDLLS